jgi:hypothetical protein
MGWTHHVPHTECKHIQAVPAHEEDAATPLAPLLAEHLRTGWRGHWISGPALARRLQRDLESTVDRLHLPSRPKRTTELR